MRPLYVRALIIGVVGTVATVATVRAARTIEHSSDPQGFLPSTDARQPQKARDPIHISDLFADLPEEARPQPNGEWAPQAWNKFQLWLGTLEGQRIRFEVPATKIAPWENPDGTRDVWISIQRPAAQIDSVTIAFDIWTPAKPIQVPGGEPVQFNDMNRLYKAVASAQELTAWFSAPQNALIRVEGVIQSASINSFSASLVLGDVSVLR